MIGDLFGVPNSELGDLFSNLLNKYSKLSNSKITISHHNETIQYTMKEIQFMQLVQNYEGINNIEAAEKLEVTKGMISKMIKNLQKKGVVERKEEGREIRLKITNTGRSHLTSFSSMVILKALEMHQEWLELDPSMRTKFKNIFVKYTEVLDILDNKT